MGFESSNKVSGTALLFDWYKSLYISTLASIAARSAQWRGEQVATYGLNSLVWLITMKKVVLERLT